MDRKTRIQLWDIAEKWENRRTFIEENKRAPEGVYSKDDERIFHWIDTHPKIHDFLRELHSEKISYDSVPHLKQDFERRPSPDPREFVRGSEIGTKNIGGAFGLFLGSVFHPGDPARQNALGGMLASEFEILLHTANVVNAAEEQSKNPKSFEWGERHEIPEVEISEGGRSYGPEETSGSAPTSLSVEPTGADAINQLQQEEASHDPRDNVDGMSIDDGAHSDGHIGGMSVMPDDIVPAPLIDDQNYSPSDGYMSVGPDDQSSTVQGADSTSLMPDGSAPHDSSSVPDSEAQQAAPYVDGGMSVGHEHEADTGNAGHQPSHIDDGMSVSTDHSGDSSAQGAATDHGAGMSMAPDGHPDAGMSVAPDTAPHDGGMSMPTDHQPDSGMSVVPDASSSMSTGAHDNASAPPDHAVMSAPHDDQSYHE